MLSIYSVLCLLAVSLSLSDCYHHGRNTHRVVKRQTVVCHKNEEYRRQDGQCNNLQFPEYGSIGSPLQRLLKAEYSDGVSKPRTQGINGESLPSAREVSVKCHGANEARSDVTLMVMQWGQFLDHDITLTHTAQVPEGTDCCNSTYSECFNINMVDDPYFTDRDCMALTRSDRTKPEDTTPQEQMNAITSFIDASNVYGSNEEETQALRGMNGELNATLTGGKSYLPPNVNAKMSECRPAEEEYCFLAGDERVNEQAALGVMHTIWMREHNRIVQKLRKRHSNWDDERLFQETRRIVGAMMQVITYNEFLPLVLGVAYSVRFSLHGSTYSYDSSVNPTIFNSFATAVFRFGHSLIPEEITTDAQVLQFKDLFMSPTEVLQHADQLAGGLSKEKAMAADRHFSNSITRHLFETKGRNGFDLVSLNIQRGRDHGLPPYTAFRNLTEQAPTSLSQLFPDDAACQSVYSDINDVDLFTGGMAEPRVPGGLVGITFAHIIAEQFERLKIGDRFFYLKKGGKHAFSRKQAKLLNEVKLSKVICANTENKMIQRDIFKPIDPDSNPLEHCSKIPDLDIDRF